jgi:hypothetical protein
MAAETVQRLALNILIDGLITGAVSQQPIYESVSQTYVDGYGIGQISNVFLAKGVVLAAGTGSINLTTALDFQGDGLAAANVKFIYFKLVTCSSGGTAIVRQATSNGLVGPSDAAAHGAKTKGAGSVILIMTTEGWTVTASTGDVLEIVVSTDSTYDLVIGVG